MLKSNENKVEGLLSKNSISSSLAAAMRGEGSDLANKAMTATGATAAWKDSKGSQYKIAGFDLVETEVRVYKNSAKNRFERLKDEGLTVYTADGNDEDGNPLGEYVLQPIAYAAAIVEGGDRSNISITALQSFARNKGVIDAKNKKVLSLSAPSPADFICMHADTLVGHTIEVLDYAEKNDRFKTKVIAFGLVQ